MAIVRGEPGGLFARICSGVSGFRFAAGLAESGCGAGCPPSLAPFSLMRSVSERRARPSTRARLDASRGARLLWAVAIQTLCVVLVQVAAEAGGGG